jgi:hypothetical protein
LENGVMVIAAPEKVVLKVKELEKELVKKLP